jgi:hypothetical protein
MKKYHFIILTLFEFECGNDFQLAYFLLLDTSFNKSVNPYFYARNRLQTADFQSFTNNPIA